ncbi:MAG: hypothetical protein ABGW97_05045 [Christiangramia sp.]|uniref:hypothetical protein n=1 Tax=Christiangramia sp. TaxID=1931228 RepID=UPI003241DFA5
MSKGSLSKNDIEKILEEAKKPKYSRTDLLHMGSTINSIRAKSSNSDLIMIYGNTNFGYKHIIKRHSPHLKKNFKDEPTKFSFLPPLEYINLAEQIYKQENLTNLEEPFKEKFDLYIGYSNFESDRKLEYNLLTYKNTGIIHTFYQSDKTKPFTKKIVLNLQEGHARSEYDLDNLVQTHEKPYFDSSGKEKLKIILKVYESENLEKWFVQLNDFGKEKITIKLKENKVDHIIIVPMRRNQFDYEHLTDLELKIKKILDGKSF